MIKEALIKKHAEGHIAKHKANVEVLLQKTAGIAEHPDTLETIEKELHTNTLTLIWTPYYMVRVG